MLARLAVTTVRAVQIAMRATCRSKERARVAHALQEARLCEGCRSASLVLLAATRLEDQLASCATGTRSQVVVQDSAARASTASSQRKVRIAAKAASTAYSREGASYSAGRRC